MIILSSFCIVIALVNNPIISVGIGVGIHMDTWAHSTILFEYREVLFIYYYYYSASSFHYITALKKWKYLWSFNIQILPLYFSFQILEYISLSYLKSAFNPHVKIFRSKRFLHRLENYWESHRIFVLCQLALSIFITI